MPKREVAKASIMLFKNLNQEHQAQLFPLIQMVGSVRANNHGGIPIYFVLPGGSVSLIDDIVIKDVNEFNKFGPRGFFHCAGYGLTSMFKVDLLEAPYLVPR